MLFKDFFFLFLAVIFVQPSGTILAIFVKGHKRNIYCEIIFLHRAIGLGGDIVYIFFYF